MLVMVESTQIIVFLRQNSVCSPQWERKANISKAPWFRVLLFKLEYFDISFIHLHIDYCIDLLKWLVKNGSCNCLSS